MEGQIVPDLPGCGYHLRGNDTGFLAVIRAILFCTQTRGAGYSRA
jgi:hypothetical protein